MFSRKLKSFTLVETIIAIFIFCLLVAAILGLALILYRVHSYEWEQSLAISEAKRGIEAMVKEIRKAKEGENGAFPIEYAGDKELVFYSDVDKDGRIERVRYFLGKIEEKTLIQECQSLVKAGSCSVSFSNFFTGKLIEAKLIISVQGDLGASNEYIDVFLDNQSLGSFCKTSCSDCPNSWQGTQTFDVLAFAEDNFLSIFATASDKVDPSCQPGGFSMKVRFELYLKYETQTSELKKGVIKPVGFPPVYPLDQEEVSVITSFVRNAPPIFEYFDESGNKIQEYPARLKNTKLMKVFLVVNVDPNKPPTEYQLESFVQIRNLKQ